MAAAGLCHSDEHIRNGDMSVPNEVMESFGLPGDVPDDRRPRRLGGGGRGRRWRHRVRAGRPRGDVVRRGLRPVPVVQLRHGVHLRHGRAGDDSRYADGRHLPASHRGRPQSRPPVEGRRVLETHCRFHGFDRQDRPAPAAAADGAAVVRDTDRVRLRGEPREGDDRRHRRRHRRRAASAPAPIQGARINGAAQIIAVDPVEFKQKSALGFGATHSVSNTDEAADLVRESDPRSDGGQRRRLAVADLRRRRAGGTEPDAQGWNLRADRA